uniref:Translocase of inner mitochondrial membrane 44 n=1 Tax=Junco hyemalis TaxID=40217 RepID=A0A8C5IWK5_JUNHY
MSPVCPEPRGLCSVRASARDLCPGPRLPPPVLLGSQLRFLWDFRDCALRSALTPSRAGSAGLTSARAAQPSWGCAGTLQSWEKSLLEEFSHKNPSVLLTFHLQVDLCVAALPNPPALSSLCAVFLQKCLLSGPWLLSRRYPIPAFPRSALVRICSPALGSPQSRCYSSGGRKGFISGFVENIKQELAKNKEMKESIKKFRDEAKKLEESDALREARRKYKTIESETVKTSEVIKKKLEEITGTVKESLDEVSKSDLGRKIKEGVEEAAKTAKQSAESVTRGGEKLGRTAAFKAISQGVETVKKEIDESVLGQTGPYRRPERLRKRTEYSGERIKEQRVFEANEEAMGMVLHKDSKWYQQWKDFKDNNVVFNRFFEMKMKYDESDNAFIRASRAVTDRVTDLIGTGTGTGAPELLVGTGTPRAAPASPGHIPEPCSTSRVTVWVRDGRTILGINLRFGFKAGVVPWVAFPPWLSLCPGGFPPSVCLSQGCVPV